jgi:hypothetical protein
MENDNIKILESKLKLLNDLPYVQAYTGNLNSLIQKSYVEYSVIINEINKIRKELNDLKK